MTAEATHLQPEALLAAEIDRIGGLAASDLRCSLAIGGYLRGRLPLDDAVAVAGMTLSDFTAQLPQKASPALADTEPRLSAVIPVYNEQANLPTLLATLVPQLERFGSYEIVFVDDGSQDSSAAIILQARDANPSIKLLQLSRNFGHQAALTAGVQHAGGAAVVLMDADLQDPPELLARFVEMWEAGNDVVYAVRTKRKEGALKRLAYWAYYRGLRRLADLEMPLDAGDFCLMDRKVVDALVALPERSRYLRGLRTWVGFRQIGVTYDRPARFAGEAKYTLRALIRLGLSGVLAFSSVPLRLASYLGFLTAGCGVLYMLAAVASRFFSGEVPDGWTSIIAIVLIIGGAQLIVTGVLGEYLSKVYDETKHRPVFLVGSAHGLLSGQER